MMLCFGARFSNTNPKQQHLTALELGSLQQQLSFLKEALSSTQ